MRGQPRNQPTVSCRQDATEVCNRASGADISGLCCVVLCCEVCALSTGEACPEVLVTSLCLGWVRECAHFLVWLVLPTRVCSLGVTCARQRRYFHSSSARQ